MGFRSKSVSKKTKSGSIKLTEEDKKRIKMSANTDNQLLRAVNEAQPFQEASEHSFNNRQSMGMFLAQKQQNLDVFGNVIRQADVSNPSRSRDERPLDTIRSFEYSISGDGFHKERLESQRLGFRPRPDFPLFNANVYNNYNNNNNNNNTHYEQPVYTAPVNNINNSGEKKKKRGLFGRKK